MPGNNTITNALITGASRGLGRALALELAKSHEGIEIVLVARHAGPLEEVAQEVREAGGRPHAIVADVSRGSDIAEVAARAQSLVGRVELLINNASSLGPVPLPELADLERGAMEAVFATNVFGPARLIKSLVAAMRLGAGGSVVNISSDAAVEAYPGWGAYGASKAALDHLTRVWAAELEGEGVRFVAVDPGEMNTQMHADAIPEADPLQLQSPELVARRIVSIVRGVELVPNGSRVAAAEFAGRAS